nr:PKD domain-containing protein [Allomuricauda sp.]
MPFSINIFDRQDLNSQTALETGEKGSINLSRLGSRDKLEKIMGSELAFNMEVKNFQDAFFAHLNTSDERRYWVKIIDEETGNVLWQGHMLPDTYEEPYKVGSFFVKFVATCGLGTLKNQYLPNAYYQEEKSKSDILSTILKLTGLELDIYISPAISNRSNPYWHDNYEDTSKYADGEKKDDAYTILEKILGLCRIVQDGNNWYVDGVNKLQGFYISYARYDFNGNFIGIEDQIKSPHDKTGGRSFLATPRINTSVPVKTVTAVHDLDESNIKEAVYKVPNDGWVVTSELQLVNREWTYTNVGFTAKFDPRDGKTFLEPAGSINNSVSLRKEVLLSTGDRVEWLLDCTNYWDGSGQQGRTVEEIVVDGDWQKLLRYDIFYTDPSNGNEVLLYSNENGPNSNDLRYQLYFGTDRKASMSIQMIAPATAYYNIRFYQLQVPTGAKVTGVLIDKLAANNISATEEQEYVDTIEGTYTKVSDLDIESHDDMRQLKHFTRLERLTDQGDQYGTITVNNLEVLNDPNGNYIKLTLENLLAALAHSGSVTVNGNQLLITGKIYNYLGSTEMYLQYDADDFGGQVQNGDSMQIALRKFAPVPINISQWQEWADDVYRVSFKRYGEVYVDVVRNLYSKSHPILSGTCIGFVGPRDLVMFDYDGEKVWYVLDCVQHLDQYRTTLVLSQNFYGEAVTENLPPTVDAGADQRLLGAQTTAVLTATASDPDGSIVSVLWELVSDNGNTATIESPDQLITNITNLNGNDFEFRVTVTDDVGLTATDTVRLGRERSYQLVLTSILRSERSTTPENQDRWEALDLEWFEVSISPELGDDQVARVTFDGIIVLETPYDIAGARPSAVFKMGYDFQFFTAGAHQGVVLFRKGTTKTLSLSVRAYNSAQYGIFPQYAGKVHARLQMDATAEIVQGAIGTFSNVPIQKIYDARK